MRWMARRARSTSRRARVLAILTVLATAVAYCAALLIPSNVGAATVTQAAGGTTSNQDGVPVVVIKGKYLVDGNKSNELKGLEGDEFGIKVAELVKGILERE